MCVCVCVCMWLMTNDHTSVIWHTEREEGRHFTPVLYVCVVWSVGENESMRKEVVCTYTSAYAICMNACLLPPAMQPLPTTHRVRKKRGGGVVCVCVCVLCVCVTTFFSFPTQTITSHKPKSKRDAHKGGT